ncbi:MAG TPA: radical SAM protein, partial [Pseudoflavonifractor sp.]|nr:radical SAM protein [Pseudoflavonifractor sp.]
ALELVDAYQFGVAIATKSDLITRDMDILQSVKSHSPVLCKLTVTTADDALAAKLEPHAPPPTRRLAAIRALSGAGLFTGVLLMPTLPFLEDSVENVVAVVEAAADAGARFVYPAFGVTLRQNQREYFLGELERRFPGEGLRARYERQYGTYYQCVSPNAKKLWAAFTRRCGELGLLYEMKHITSAYQHGYADMQLSFFS